MGTSTHYSKVAKRLSIGPFKNEVAARRLKRIAVSLSLKKNQRKARYRQRPRTCAGWPAHHQQVPPPMSQVSAHLGPWPMESVERIVDSLSLMVSKRSIPRDVAILTRSLSPRRGIRGTRSHGLFLPLSRESFWTCVEERAHG